MKWSRACLAPPSKSSRRLLASWAGRVRPPKKGRRLSAQNTSARFWPAPGAGSTVALVSPASYADPDKVLGARELLASLGLHTIDLTEPGPLDQHVRHDAGLRAEHLAKALLAPEVSAVFCVEGGYGSMQVVDLLPWGTIAKAQPKPVVGYSDNTALLMEVRRQTGWVTVHGPHVAGPSDPTAQLATSRLLAFLRQPSAWQMSPTADTHDDNAHLPAPLQAVTGELVGGNLTMLAALSGGCPPPRYPIVLALEDVGEADYRVDRCLWQLRRSGFMAHVKAVLLGTWTDCSGNPAEVVRDHFRHESATVPVISMASFGHVPSQVPLPIGAQVRVGPELTVTLSDGCAI